MKRHISSSSPSRTFRRSICLFFTILIFDFPWAFGAVEVSPPVASNLQNESVSIAWTSGFIGTGSVIYGTGATESRISEGTGDSRAHLVNLPGLLPGQSYWFYTVTSGNEGTVTENRDGRNYGFETPGPEVEIPPICILTGRVLMADGQSAAPGALVLLTPAAPGRWFPTAAKTSASGLFSISATAIDRLTLQQATPAYPFEFSCAAISGTGDDIAATVARLSEGATVLGDLKLGAPFRDFKVSICKGFNLVALPCEPSSPLMASGFLELCDSLLAVYSYSAGAYLLMARDQEGNHTGTDFEMVPGAGYFVKGAGPCEITIKGRGLERPGPMKLSKGFNLAGFSASAPAGEFDGGSGYDLLETLEATGAPAVYLFDAESQCYRAAFKVDDGVLAQSNPLVRDRDGFFVKCMADATVLNQNRVKLSGRAREMSGTGLIESDSSAGTVKIDPAAGGAVVPGEILIGTAGEGFLSRVVSVDEGTNEVTLKVEQATLEDAVEECDLWTSRELTMADLNVNSLGRGVRLKSYDPVGGFFFEIADMVLYDLDGDSGTAGDQVRMTAALNLRPSIETMIRIRCFKLREFRFVFTVDQGLSMNFTAGVSAEILGRRVVRKICDLNPIVLPTTPPLVLSGTLNGVLGFEGEFQAGLASGLTQTASLNGGVAYDAGQWTPIGSWKVDFGFSPPKLRAGGTARVSLGPQISYKLYGVAGPHFTAQGYGELSVAPGSDPWWTLRGGIEAAVGVRIEALSRTLADFSAPFLIDYATTIAQSPPGENEAPSIVVIAPNGGEILSGLQVVSWRALDPDGTQVTVSLDFSGNGGSTWFPMARGLTGDTHVWDTERIPDGDRYLVKAIATDGLAQSTDLSNAIFSIDNNSAPVVQLVSPNGGEVLSGTRGVVWTAFDPDEGGGTGIDRPYPGDREEGVRVTLSFSRDGGATWITLAEGLSNTGTFPWNTLGTQDGPDYRLRVSAFDGMESGMDESDSSFSVANGGSNTPPSVELLSPTGGESWSGSRAINWLASDPDGDELRVTISFSGDSGETWEILFSGLSSSGTYSWNTLSTPDTARGRIGVSAFDGTSETRDESRGDFSVDNPALNGVPAVSNLSVSGVSGEVEISYDLIDPEGDPCSVAFRFRGGTLGTAWRKATVFGETREVVPGAGKRVFWSSATDQPGIRAADFALQAIPHDGAAYGPACESHRFGLDNRAGPETGRHGLFVPWEVTYGVMLPSIDFDLLASHGIDTIFAGVSKLNPDNTAFLAPEVGGVRQSQPWENEKVLELIRECHSRNFGILAWAGPVPIDCFGSGYPENFTETWLNLKRAGFDGIVVHLGPGEGNGDLPEDSAGTVLPGETRAGADMIEFLNGQLMIREYISIVLPALMQDSEDPGTPTPEDYLAASRLVNRLFIENFDCGQGEDGEAYAAHTAASLDFIGSSAGAGAGIFGLVIPAFPSDGIHDSSVESLAGTLAGLQKSSCGGSAGGFAILWDPAFAPLPSLDWPSWDSVVALHSSSPSRPPGSAYPLTVDPVAGMTMEFRYVPPGTFSMGSPFGELGRRSEEIQHTVTLTKGFLMARHETTQALWRSVMGNEPSQYPGESLPVEGVTWNDCAVFCNRLSAFAGLSQVYYSDPDFSEPLEGRPPLTAETAVHIRHGVDGYRLPTEAEWEYACRAGTATALNTGKDLTDDEVCPNMDEAGRYYGNLGDGAGGSSFGYTAVGSYVPNSWGICDTHGNVFEWCQDWYGPYPEIPVADPAGPLSGTLRIFRGGCYAYPAVACRSAYRQKMEPWIFGNLVGFRIIRPLPSGTVLDITPPQPGEEGELKATDVEGTSFSLSWVSGSDDTTPSWDLEYLAVRSERNDVATISGARANGTIVSGWDTGPVPGSDGRCSLRVEGLSAGTEYFFNILVRDRAGNRSAYTAISVSTASPPAERPAIAVVRPCADLVLTVGQPVTIALDLADPDSEEVSVTVLHGSSPEGAYSLGPVAGLAGISLNPGSHSLIWETSDTSPGTYYIQVRAIDGTSLESSAAPAVSITLAPEMGSTAGALKIFNIHPPTNTPCSFSYIPPGTFSMGSPQEHIDWLVEQTGWTFYQSETRHTVTLKRGFHMARHEVTQEQWTETMGSNPSYYTGAGRPVEKLTWYDCAIFCNRLSAASGLAAAYYTDEGFSSAFDGTPPFTAAISIYIKGDADGYRLPTEAEWEYACRAGTTLAYNDSAKNDGAGSDCLTPAGSADENLNPLGRYLYNRDDGRGGYDGGHTSAGSYQANAWFLYDMHGNVWEWCQDFYGIYPTESVTDPQGPASGSAWVIRGGGYNVDAGRCRSAMRTESGYASQTIGFRLVRNAP